jgi:hypothetical protein
MKRLRNTGTQYILYLMYVKFRYPCCASIELLKLYRLLYVFKRHLALPIVVHNAVAYGVTSPSEKMLRVAWTKQIYKKFQL